MNNLEIINNIKSFNKPEIINKIHSLIVIYILFGWIIESQRVYLVLFLPTLQFQFLINNNKCLLTQLEAKLLKEEKKDNNEEDDEDDEDDKSFINKKLKQFGINLNPMIREYIIHGSVYSSFLISYYLM